MAIESPIRSDHLVPFRPRIGSPTDRGKVVVVGQGYVGLPLAVRAAEVGYSVVGFESDPFRVKQLRVGESYIEDVSSEELAAAARTGRYLAADDSKACRGFDVAVITVPTPLCEGRPDLRCVEEAASMLGTYLTPGATVVLESTTYPGTTEEVVAPLLEMRSGLRAGEDFHLGYSPERIDPGNSVWKSVDVPKIVSGVNRSSLDAVRRFYENIVHTTIPVDKPAEAELAKLLENTFRHVNIALVNELAMFASDLGIDIWKVIDAASTKPYGFMPFRPGPGVGGHCLPVDPSYLSWRVSSRLGRNFRFIELANDVNAHMPEYVCQRLTYGLNRRSRAVKGARVLLLGLAYKPDTGDARESPAVSVARRLVSLGAEVRAADPHVVQADLGDSVLRVDATVREAAAADAVVLLTDHAAFDIPALAAASGYFLDTRHRATGPAVETL
ncbi:MAG: nucleotide sugar dehydrogenase [Acidimicrobiales bacterium]